tara:strand:- start:1330 stop:1974 length:645 start_codon:yes stop_codon:yes gene_type:complete
MDEDLLIINTNTRNQKIKDFFVNHKSKIIFSIIIVLIILITVFSYDKYTENKKREISVKYNSTIIDYSEETKEETSNRLIEIINKKDPTYSPLSLYFIIDNDLVKEQDKINSLFDMLIDNTSLDKEIKNLIIYKKALYNADSAKEGELLTMLNPLINSETVWKSHSLYLIAEYFYANNQNQKAKEFFNKILSNENLSPDIKIQAEKRLNRDLSD